MSATRAKRSSSVKAFLLGAVSRSFYKQMLSKSFSLARPRSEKYSSKEFVVVRLDGKESDFRPAFRRHTNAAHLVEQPFGAANRTHRVDERARQFASSIVAIVRHAREIRRPLPGRDGRVARAVASSLCSFVVVSTTVPTRFFASLDRSRLHLCVQSNDVSLSLSLSE